MSYVELSTLDLVLAALLLVINGAISLAFGLRLENEGQFQIVDDVAKGVAGLEEAGALHHDQRFRPAEVQAGGEGDRFAFTRRSN